MTHKQLEEVAFKVYQHARQKNSATFGNPEVLRYYMTSERFEEYNKHRLDSMHREINTLLESLGELVQDRISKEENC